MKREHRYIRFTSETDQNNIISFLDINITCEKSQLKASVYKKPTFSDVFTHYENYIDQS